MGIRQSGNIPVQVQLDPQSVASSGTATGAYALADECANYVALCNLGATTGGNATFTILQAKDDSGTSAKALGAYSSGAMSTASSSASFDVSLTGLDVSGGFKYIAIKVAVATATCLVGATLIGCNPKYAS